MTTEKLIYCSLTAAEMEWLTALFQALEEESMVTFEPYLAEDCCLQIGNSLLAQVKEEVLLNLKKFWWKAGSLVYHLINVFHDEVTIISETEIDFSRQKEAQKTLSAAVIFQRDKGESWRTSAFTWTFRR